MRSIFNTATTAPKHLKPLALLTALTLALTACGTDDKPHIGGTGNGSSTSKPETKTIQNTPVVFISAVNSSSNLSEGGQLSFEVTLTDDAKEALKNSDKTDFTVTYTLTGDSIDPSQKTGTVTLNKDKLSETVTVPLKSDGKASDNNKVGVTLSNPTTTATNAKSVEVSQNTGNFEKEIANNDSGVQVSSTTVTKGSGESTVSLVVSLAPKALDKDTKVFFDLVQGTAKENTHYKKPADSSVTIKKGETEATINITLIGDAPTTPVEFSVKLLNTNNGTPLYEGKSIATVRLDSYVAEKAELGALNDTGVTYSGVTTPNADGETKGTDDSCVDTRQDCNVGRDKTANDDADGVAGFSFTKLDKLGNELASSATEWACVKDNVTGLIWETKTFNSDASKKDIRDASWTYTYYSGKNNFGEKDTGKDSLKDKDSCGNEQHICTTEQYAVTVNAMNLCGVKNWRVPTRTEIFGVMNLSSKQKDVVMHKGWLMPNNIEASDIPSSWTSSVAPDNGNMYKFGSNVWLAYASGSFSSENVKGRYSVPANGVILVSNGK